MQRLIDAEEGDGTDAHARQQNQIHVSGTDQVREGNAKKRAEHGDGDGLRPLLRREVSHVMRVYEAVANACPRCASCQPTDILPHIR